MPEREVAAAPSPEVGRRGNFRYNRLLRTENLAELTDLIESNFTEDEPIFYRSDPRLRDLLGISHQTLNDILTIARQHEAIASPIKISDGRTGYAVDEIIKAFAHFAEVRSQQGLGLETTARQLREVSATSEKLTIAQAAKRLGVSATVFLSWIREGKVDLGSEAQNETAKRIKHGRSNKKKLVDPSLLAGEAIQKLQREASRHEPVTGYRLKRYPEHFTNVSTIVFLAAGYYLASGDIGRIGQILEKEGFRVFKIRDTRGFHWVLDRDDQQQAAATLREKYQRELARKRPVLSKFPGQN